MPSTMGKSPHITTLACVVIMALGGSTEGRARVSPLPLLSPSGPPLQSDASRIVGGTEAYPHQYPHQVALFVDYLTFCGGTLISEEWVLTAAHCVNRHHVVDLIIGAHDIDAQEEGRVQVTSSDFFTHEDYDSFDIRNDIALIRLPSPVVLTDHIQPAPLPTADIEVGTLATIIGWGRTSDATSGISGVLRAAQAPVITNSDCRVDYNIVADTNVCVSTEAGMGTCSGDSGGPLLHQGIVYGVTSFGSSEGCEAGHPDAFTRIFLYLDWIEAKTGITPRI